MASWADSSSEDFTSTEFSTDKSAFSNQKSEKENKKQIKEIQELPTIKKEGISKKQSSLLKKEK